MGGREISVQLAFVTGQLAEEWLRGTSTEYLEARGKVASLRDRKNFTLLVLGVRDGGGRKALRRKETTARAGTFF